MAGDTLPAVAVSAFADIIRAALPSPERQHEEDTLGTTPPVAGVPQFSYQLSAVSSPWLM